MPSAIGFMAAKIDHGREVPRLSPRCPGNQKLGRYPPPASDKPGLFKEAVEPTGWLTGLIPEQSVRPPCLVFGIPESIGTEPPTCKTLRVPDRSTSDSYQPDFALARASDGAPQIACATKVNRRVAIQGSSNRRTWLRSRG
jgi:hypothetical protein